MAEIQFEGKEWEVSDALQAFYVPYASYVIQTRALPDARDGLKTGARFILYAQYKDKLTCKDKRRKAVATINGAMRYSPHGDASILGTAVRLSQEFSLRYPIIEVQGNNGSYMSGDDYSQARYLEMRGNEIAYEMTELLNKNTINDWKLNYTEEEEYPTVLPSKFPFSLVNGSFGIGVACSSSVPPHNIKDVAKALEILINNPNATFEELYCPIDFPTGGIIINENEVKNSLKNGTGKAALVRAKIEYDSDNHELIVNEMPYMTFTNNAVASISKAIEEGLLLGVESVYDGTDFDGCKIVIKLTKNANVEKVVKLLYKHTILQNSYSINMNMLDNGKTPKLFTWKESMEAYLQHLKTVMVKAYQYDLEKLLERIHILEGLIIAFHNIEELVKDIRKSINSNEAKSNIMSKYSLSDKQADAILKMRLSSLTHLEIEKLENEKNDKVTKANNIKEILSSEERIKQEMINEIHRLSDKYGDERRTKNINLEFKDDNDEEPIEEKELLIHCTNLGNIYTQETSTLLTQKRGGKGVRIKLQKGETIINTIEDNNLSSLIIFTSLGKMYAMSTDDLPINSRVNLYNQFDFEKNEKITTITTFQKKDLVKYYIFITKNGMIKKSLSREYTIRKGKSIKAINLKDGDSVVNVCFCNDDKVGLLTSAGNFVIIDTAEINAIGRVSMGVKGVKLIGDETVISGKVIPDMTREILSITERGKMKKSEYNDFGVSNRGVRGSKIQKINDDDKIVDFIPIVNNNEVTIISSQNILKINLDEIKTSNRLSVGVKGIEINDNEKVIGLL